MQITSFATPALLFPAISLLMLSYTNKFLAIASLIRGDGIGVCDATLHVIEAVRQVAGGFRLADRENQAGATRCSAGSRRIACEPWSSARTSASSMPR